MKKGPSQSAPVAQHDHYSYSVYADPATARSFDERRFGGPIGSLVADEQARVLAEFVGNARNRSVLDVGTGTGRAAMVMARGGACVTAVDASPEMLTIARVRAAEENLSIRFLPGDAHRLEFPDRAFDLVMSLRVLMHAPDWRTCVAELCRVAGRLLIIDYPSASSFAALEAIARHVTHALGAKTEPYRVLSGRTVERELRAHHFQIRSVHRQFVLPIALHKAIGSRRLTISSRQVSNRLGLLKLFGSPVTLVAERCEF
jgi:ubiquinone/menaquinone biosynthesis C-methylase UbiE